MSGASNVLGFGTAFRGRFELKGDGSYVTAKWIVVAGLPVYPLSCWRHHPYRDIEDSVSRQPYQDEESKILFSGENSFRNSESCQAAERVALRWCYVGKQLLCSLGLILWLLVAFPVFRQVIVLTGSQNPTAVFSLLIGYFVLLPFVLVLLIGVCFDRIWGKRYA